MKEFIEKYWKTILFFAAVGLFGGFFTEIFILESYPQDIKSQIYEEFNASGLGNLPISIDILLGAVTAMQSASYGIILGGLGILLGKKTALWRDERKITKKPLLITLAIAIAGGLLMILPDIFFFGNHSVAIMDSYATKPSIAFILASVTYGAIIEEVMLRLFAMSLVAFVIHKLLDKKHDKPTVATLVAANVVTATLFAMGHLPATFTLLGDSPIIILRCLLLNGIFGLAFGYLYRKYGLRYSMIAHGGCHLVSKLIWILFI